MKKRFSLVFVVLLLASIPIVLAPTKIVPTHGEPGRLFTIIDAPDGRLVDGTTAIFILDGAATEVNLNVHKSEKTAQGNVPNVGGGDYTVLFRQPDGITVDVGTFTVDAPAVEPQEPTIEPSEGLIGSRFTITDPQGRIEQGDIAVFYLPGNDPSTGAEAIETSIPDANTFTGTVPAVLVGLNNVALMPPGGPIRFELSFIVT